MSTTLRPIGTEFGRTWSSLNYTNTWGMFRNVKETWKVVAHVLSGNKVGSREAMVEEVKMVGHEVIPSSEPLFKRIDAED